LIDFLRYTKKSLTLGIFLSLENLSKDFRDYLFLPFLAGFFLATFLFLAAIIITPFLKNFDFPHDEK